MFVISLNNSQMKVYPNSDVFVITNINHPIFKFIEKKFYEWIESSNPAHEYHEQYFGEDAVADKKGAIQGAIESALEEANETQKPVNLVSFDFDAVFAL